MATLQRGIKIEITHQLNSSVANTFAQWIGCYNVIWNCKVAENQKVYQTYLEAKSSNENIIMPRPNQAVAHFITPERAWLSEIPSQIRRNAGTKFVEAINACIKGLRKAPRFKQKYDKKNCVVSNELFDIQIKQDKILFLFKRTNAAKSFCTIEVPKNERLMNSPKLVYLSRKGARFWLSFSYQVDMPEVREVSAIIEQLKQSPSEYQSAAVLGMDVGVIKPIALSGPEALFLGYTPSEITTLERKNIKRRRYQKKLSRQREMAKKQNKAISKNTQKTQARLSDSHAHMSRVRMNMAHRVSKQVAEQAVEVVVCEKLNIKGMTGRAKAKQDPQTGKWLVNGASRKAGLTKRILNVGWGRILNFLSYKLRERDKTIIYIPAHYSSQECVKCEHVSKENRPTQEKFYCVRCGYIDNADHNGASVLKKRFLVALNTGKFVLPTKTVKRIAIRKKSPPELRLQSVELT